MGCDIHVYTEVKKNVDGKTKWVCSDHFKKNSYYGTDEYEKEWDVCNIYDDRNYALFAILADVRNYGDNKPITEPKGLPKDCCQETKAEYERWDGDGHSHSWYTLKELIDYVKTQPKVKYSGLITQKQAIELDENGTMPEEWCQGSSDITMVHREWETPFEYLNPIIDALTARLKEFLWIYRDEDVEPQADKIRMIFWFDN